VRIVRLLIVAIPFYFVYGGLRSIVDAAALKAYNTRNILISLVLFLIAVVPLTIYSAPRYLLEGLAASVVAAMGFLAWLTWRTVRRLFQIHLPGARVLPGISLALTLGGGSFLLHNVLRFQPGLAALIFYQTTLLVVYFAALWRLRSPWLQFLGDLFRSDQSFNPRTAA
jgi:O-antigen/teichoic acid export membrane protein